jgi:hypothetical protein
MPRRFLVVVAALGLASGAWAAPAARAPADPAAPAEGKSAGTRPGDSRPAETKPAGVKPAGVKPAEVKRTDAKPAALPPPIVFYVATGEADACGPGCREWIAAEGTIDTGADGRLRAFLKRLGGRKLPIFFHSPGGSVPNGLAIGRLLRTHGLTASVAHTVPAGCDPQQQPEEACDRLKRSGHELVATLDTTHAMCNSSCVYAFVGAAVREVPVGVTLGIHSSSISFSLRRTYPDGHMTRVPTQVSSQTMRNAIQAGYDRVAVYLREMGLPPALLAAAREVPSDRLHFLTRDEIAEFGIDRRDLVEGAWWFIDQPPEAAAVKLFEVKDPGASGYHRTILRLSCRSAAGIRLQYGHEVSVVRGSNQARLRLTAGGIDFALMRGTATIANGNRPSMQMYTATLPASALKDAIIAIEAVAPSGTERDAPTASFAAVTVRATGAAFDALLRRCSSGPDHNDAGSNPSRAAPGSNDPSGGAPTPAVPDRVPFGAGLN